VYSPLDFSEEYTNPVTRLVMTILKSLIPLVLLAALLLVACDQQTATKALEIPAANKATASFAVEGMT